MVDDGTGAKEIFRVDNFDLVQVPDEDHGKFYSGDCYVILYAYNTGSQDRFIIYFWLVSKQYLFAVLILTLKIMNLKYMISGKIFKISCRVKSQVKTKEAQLL